MSALRPSPIAGPLLRGAGVILLGLALPATAFGQGLIMPGAGAANRAMAGASMAAPLDAAGAGYWNPAAISGLPGNQVYFGADLVYADLRVATDPLPPPGSTFSDTGVSAIPTIALVYHREDSAVTTGLGVYGLVGGAVNFGSRQPGPPFAALTNQYASAAGLMIAPTVSVQVSDCLAVALGPTVDVMGLSLDPAFFAPNGPPGSFPAATHGRPFWGAGFRAGMYYELNPCWSFGLSYLSPQWFETFRWNALDGAGAPQQVRLEHQLPSVLSWGAAYRGISQTVLALDVRYFDYAGSVPYGNSVADGGTAWQSIFSVAMGAERRLSERTKMRMGYLYNENPIRQVLTMFNTQLPAINQHQISLGFSMQLNRSMTMDFTWVHGFDNSIRGPVPGGEIPGGATVQLDQSMDSWVVGMGVDF